MGKRILLLLTMLMMAGCGSLSEEEVVEETMENIGEVHNYELEIVSSVQGDEMEDIYSMEIDMENNQGSIGIDLAERYDADPVEMYYDHENVYEKTQEGEWRNSGIPVEEMHAIFFIDYPTIAQTLEFIAQKEETAFEEAKDFYTFSYQASEGEAAAFLDEWGFDSEVYTDIDDIAAQFQMNESTLLLDHVNLELMMRYEDGEHVIITHELQYNNINGLSEIEVPDGIEKE
ncbi:DUF6612 family protein [Oceanobacillus sp. CFH 90083]|uniref:DUF6612 family protein n=1 Tax=Oceanobacillus sp. CFH 90083 TaxID=2592336 RepID=UPI00128D14B8|nr:DUF6612 family protein [Oceanobacillus sp. CFH 90083]